MGNAEDQEQIKKLRKEMRDLRSKIYSERIDAIRECLGFTNEVSRADIEAFLIYAVEEKYQNTIKRDYMLADWGLLCGYSNHRKLGGADDSSAAVTERRKKFLRESTYIYEKRKDCDSYEDAEKKGKVPTIISTLGTATRRCIGEEGKTGGLAEWLYRRRNNKGFLEEAKQKHNPSFCVDYIPDEQLPTLLNVRSDSPTEESLLTDTEQSVDEEPVDSADEFDECEPEAYIDDEPTSGLPPDSPEDTEESSEEPSGQNPLLSIEELLQSIEDSDKTFWDKPEDEPGPGPTILPVGKWKKMGAILTICCVLGICIWGFYSVFQEGGIKGVIKGILQGLAFFVALIIAILALGLLAAKAFDISYARKSNSKTRRSYTVQKIKDGVLGKRIVFNSISDGPVGYGYRGNEKKFVSAGKIKDGKVVKKVFGFIKAEDGAEYLIRVFIHNDNPNGYDAIAEHCRVKICIPSIPSREARVRGVISSDNARPKEYWDSVTFYSSYTPFKLVCLEPAMLYNDGIGQNGYSLDQRVNDSEGALIGYDYCDGKIPGGDGYESIVLLKVQVVFDDNFVVNFKGHNYGPDGWQWQHAVEADVWGTIHFRIGYKNSSSAKEPQQNVTVSIDLPECLCYVPGSALLDPPFYSVFDSRSPNYNQLFLPNGVNIGDFNPGTGATISFRVEVVDRGLSSGYTEAFATVKISVGEVTKYDTVKIIINKE